MGFLSHRFLATGLLLAALSPCAWADPPDFSQIDSLANSQIVNKKGSDQSLRESTTNAMNALMKLAAADRSGAISKGYEAFGQYRNSGNLDSMRLKNSITALKLDSIGSYISQNGGDSIFMAPLSAYTTSYARLDPAFLRSGEAGKIADEFEKQTGMKRESFLKKMAQASESDIKASDPQLVDKVLSRFEGFVNDIPNQDFRDKLQKQIDAVPQTVRTGLIGQAVQKFTQLLAAGSTGASKSDIALMAKNAGKDSSAGPSPTASGSEANGPAEAADAAKGADDRSPASAAPMLAERREYRNINDDKFGSDAVGGALQTAVDEQTGDDTIFKQVSRKYRSLAPALAQKTL